jgi:hypothetical protein
VGDTRVDVLAADPAFHDTRSDPNNNSLVLKATVHGVSILLPGDVEEPAQRALLQSAASLDTDVLKVPHHGSGYFSAEFFEAASPDVAVISVGAGNSYGHPHHDTLRQLKRQHVTTMRTDIDGDSAVIATPHGLAVMSGGDPHHDRADRRAVEPATATGSPRGNRRPLGAAAVVRRRPCRGTRRRRRRWRRLVDTARSTEAGDGWGYGGQFRAAAAYTARSALPDLYGPRRWPALLSEVTQPISAHASS